MIADLKPYPVMKDSGVPWLGRIPEHWKQLPGRACYRAKQTPNTGLVETTVLSLSYGRIVVKPVDKLHGLVPASFETYQIVEPGDIIVRPTDLQNDWNSLRFGLSHNRGIITSAYLCFHTSPLLSREYGHLLLHTYDLNKVFYGLGSGLRQNLDWTDFKCLPCVVPPHPEQVAIVGFLDHADRRIRRYIRAKQKLVALLEEQKRTIIHRAVTRGLDPNVRLKPSGMGWLGDVPITWVRMRLKDVANVETGLTLGKHYRSSSTSPYPYLRVANVQAGRLDLRIVKTIEVPETEARACRLENGDVLMTEGGDIDKLGRGCVWNGEIPDCLHQNHIFAVRCRSRLLPEYLVALMGSGHGRAYFQSTAKQTTNLAATNSSTLRAFPMFLPDVPEQRQILSVIAAETAAQDRASSDARREIALLMEYRTRLIADVATGKVDVRDVATRLPNEAREAEPFDEAAIADDPQGDTSDDPDAVPEEAEA